MNIFLSHHTALQLIRRARLFGCDTQILANSQDAILLRSLKEAISNRKTSSIVPTSSDVPSVNLFEKMGVFNSQCMDEPIRCNCLPENRARSKRIMCYGLKMQTNSFIRVAPRIFVARPEALIVQMSQCLSETDLTLLAYELCGTYTYLDEAKENFLGVAKGIEVVDIRYAVNPVMSATSLKKYLDDQDKPYGLQKAYKVVANILDYSASPMESRVAMMFVTPSRYGGYGLPHPKLNHSIDFSQVSSANADKRVCDFYWHDYKFAVEYDSLAFHNSNDNISRDAVRRNELLSKGIAVFTLTTKQCKNFELFNKQMQIICKHLGHRFRSESNSKRIALHKKLFYRSSAGD